MCKCVCLNIFTNQNLVESFRYHTQLALNLLVLYNHNYKKFVCRFGEGGGVEGVIALHLPMGPLKTHSGAGTKM